MSAAASKALADARAHVVKALLELKQAREEVFSVRGIHPVHVELGLHMLALGNVVNQLNTLATSPKLRTRAETPEEGP